MLYFVGDACNTTYTQYEMLCVVHRLVHTIRYQFTNVYYMNAYTDMVWLCKTIVYYTGTVTLGEHYIKSDCIYNY